MIYTNDELNVLIEQTLNLHGLDAVVNLIADIVERNEIHAYKNGYNEGYEIGLIDGYEAYNVFKKEERV